MIIETGLSDFHQSSLMVMKVFYKKQKPNIIKYRSYRSFDNEAFISNLPVAFSKICNENEILSFETFQNIVDPTLKTCSIKKAICESQPSTFPKQKNQ